MTTTAADPAATTAVPPRRRRPWGGGPGPTDVRRYTPLARAGLITALAVLAVLWLAPLVWALLTSLKHEADTTTVALEVWPDRGFTLDAYASVLANGGIITWFVNSTIVTVVVRLVDQSTPSRCHFWKTLTPAAGGAVSVTLVFKL